MARKISALFALAAFSLFDLACIPLKPNPSPRGRAALDPAGLGPQASELKIVGAVLKTGTYISFDEKQPARLSPEGDAVVGMTYQMLEIADDAVKNIIRGPTGEITEIETQDGRSYKVISAAPMGDRTRYRAFGPVALPLSDLQQVWIKTSKRGGVSALTYVTVAGLAAAMVFLVIAVSRQEPDPTPPGPIIDSCPFVYSWNGESYVLDAEPYGAAVTEGLKRTDWIELSELRPAGGGYRVLLANELDETQYTDELKLVAVDHAPGVRVAADAEGRIHTFGEPQPPSHAVDKAGNDILSFVKDNDRSFWLSPLEGRDADGTGEFKDELTFEFPKPPGAKAVKLLADVWSSPWASAAGREFLALHGSVLDDVYGAIDLRGDAYDRYWSWMADEDLFRLNVRVETAGGWKIRAEIMGGAPFISKDRAYVLAIDDVPGEVLRLRLTPAVNFWAINALAVEYGEDTPIRVTEIAAEKAVDREGRDVRTALAAADGLYLEDRDRGDRTEINFPAPPLAAGFERTLLVKASGYYRIHIDAAGEPQRELIGRILGEAGFAARHFFRSYKAWEAGLLGQQARAER